MQIKEFFITVPANLCLNFYFYLNEQTNKNAFQNNYNSKNILMVIKIFNFKARGILYAFTLTKH